MEKKKPSSKATKGVKPAAGKAVKKAAPPKPAATKSDRVSTLTIKAGPKAEKKTKAATKISAEATRRQTAPSAAKSRGIAKRPGIVRPAAVKPAKPGVGGVFPGGHGPAGGVVQGSSPIPEGIVDLFEAASDPSLSGKQLNAKLASIVRKLEPKVYRELVDAFDWEGPVGLRVFSKIAKRAPDARLKGGMIANFEAFPDSGRLGEMLELGNFESSDVRELLDRLCLCCCCCHCWPVRPWRFCRFCHRHQCKVDVQGTGSVVTAHKLTFPGATVVAGAGGSEASITCPGGSGGVSATDLANAISAHDGATSPHPGKFAPPHTHPYAPDSHTSDTGAHSGLFAPPHTHPYAPDTHTSDAAAHPGLFAPKTFAAAGSTGYATIDGVDTTAKTADLKNSIPSGTPLSAKVSLSDHAHSGYAPTSHTHPYAPDTHTSDSGAHPGLFAPPHTHPYAPDTHTTDAAAHPGLFAAAGHGHLKYYCAFHETDSMDIPNANVTVESGGWLKFKAVKRSVSGDGPFFLVVHAYAERKDRADFKYMVAEQAEIIFETDGVEDWLCVRIKAIRTDGIIFSRGLSTWDASVATGYYLKLNLEILGR